MNLLQGDIYAILGTQHGNVTVLLCVKEVSFIRLARGSKLNGINIIMEVSPGYSWEFLNPSLMLNFVNIVIMKIRVKLVCIQVLQ